MGLENNYFNGKNLVYNYGHICQFDDKTSGDETNPGLIHTAHAIVFAGRFSSAATDCIPSLNTYLTQLTQHSQVRGTQVLVIGQKNFGWNNNAVMRIHPDERYTLHVAMLENVSEANNAMQDTLSRVRGIPYQGRGSIHWA